jgi:heterodisulfide reductase subunit C2
MASANVVVPHAKSRLLTLVEEQSGQKVMSCYQCGKCSAGCPMADGADVGPHQVMRAVQLGIRPMALGNEMIWLCLTCQTCTARCPREIDVAAVMETLRHIALADGVKPAARDLYIFHRAFLETVKRGGRVYELGVGAMFNGLSGKLLTNAGLLPRMMAKGKLGLVPHRARGTDEVDAIFRRVAAIEEKLRRDAAAEERAKKSAGSGDQREGPVHG